MTVGFCKRMIPSTARRLFLQRLLYDDRRSVQKPRIIVQARQATEMDEVPATLAHVPKVIVTQIAREPQTGLSDHAARRLLAGKKVIQNRPLHPGV